MGAPPVVLFLKKKSYFCRSVDLPWNFIPARITCCKGCHEYKNSGGAAQQDHRHNQLAKANWIKSHTGLPQRKKTVSLEQFESGKTKVWPRVWDTLSSKSFSTSISHTGLDCILYEAWATQTHHHRSIRKSEDAWGTQNRHQPPQH